MRSLALRSLWAHKRRLLSTVAAVMIGVAFLAGTLVLGDTTRASFDALFQRANAGTDVIVRPQAPDGSDHEADDTAFVVVLDEAVVPRIAAVEGVARVEPSIGGYGRLIGRDGQPLGTMGPPAIAANWITDPAMNPYRLVEGRAPATDTEVVIDQGSALKGQLRVGDATTVQTPAPVPVTVTGIASYGEEESAGGSTFVAFTFEGAQRHVLHQPGRITTVSVAGDGRVGQGELARRITAVLPAGAQAITGSELAQNQRNAIDADFLDFFNWFLLAFAGIALLVATFSIHNTFSILLAQRTRESALLRALGASRRQILTATVAETAIIGVVASVLGLAAGLGLAVALREVFALIGADLPTGDLVLNLRTVLVTLTVGTVVTVLAGLLPARRSSRVPPLAALRDVNVDRSNTSPLRLGTGAVFLVAGGAVVLHAAMGGGDLVLARVAAGAVVGLVGVVALGPVLVAAITPVIGWPLARLRGTTGRLARENARRNPRRTAGTAAALMIGVAVVTAFTVMAQSLKVSFTETITDSFGGDLVVSTEMTGADLPPDLAGRISERPEVRTAVGLGGVPARIDGRHAGLTLVDPVALSDVLDLDVTGGSIETLGARQLAVGSDELISRGWKLGQTLPVAFTDGTTSELTIGAVYERADVVGSMILPRAGWTAPTAQDRDNAVLVKLEDGVAVPDGRTAVEGVVRGLAGVQVNDRDQFLASFGGQIDQQLVLIYVMLVLAIIIALLGIANTLALSLHERVRELGLLRAVGQTRRQVRSMVRGESVIIALFGTVTGVSLGVFLGWALVMAASSEGVGTFSAAPTRLALVALAGGLAGVLAAHRPARRASKINVLAALATE